MNLEIIDQYVPSEDETEAASSSYLMSLVVVMAGLPLPIVNLIATVIFWLAQRKSSYYIKWHAMQALLSQLFLFTMNTYGFWWSVAIIFTDATITSNYIAYMLTILTVNIVEFIATIIVAIQSRKGKSARIFVFAELTDLLVKPNEI